ncbi:MAG TPA: hypothetical protein VJ793_23370 [Anaerolineae bacterium]|nr:hypothetical protein [Anaerolineae bacterium]
MHAFDQSLAISSQAGSLYGQAQAKIGIGLVENRRGNVAAAVVAWQDALRGLETIGSPDAQVVRQTLQQAQP